MSKKFFRQAEALFETSKKFQKVFDWTRKTTLMVYLRAKCRLTAVALRIALRGSLSHYLSLRVLWLAGFIDKQTQASVAFGNGRLRLL
nr:hypothetical protein [uncultured Flavonifractor sp.]